MANFTLDCGKLNNRQDPIKLGAIKDFRDPRIVTLTQAKNVDLDNNGLAKCRLGQDQVYSGVTHSFWVHPFDDSIAYFVVAGTLYQLNSDYSATSVTTLPSDLEAAYEVVGDEIVISTDETIGWLAGSAFTAFSQTLLDEFEEALPAGGILAYDHTDNILLTAVGGVVTRSKPYNVMVKDKRLDKFPFDGAIQMLATVEDGWWVATDRRVGFVQRVGEDDYRYTHVSDNPPPLGCFKAGWERVDGGSRRIVTWASVDGFCEGRSGGSFTRLSEDVALPSGSRGKLFTRNLNGIDQHIAVILNPENVETFTTPTLPLNTITATT